MPALLVAAAAAAGLAAALTVGALVAATTLLPAGGRARAAAVRLAGAAAVSWSAAALAVVVASAPRDGAALGDPAGGAAVVAWALGGGAPLALGALGAAGLATVVLVRPGGRPGAAWSGAGTGLGALALAVLAAAPLGALPATLSSVLAGMLPAGSPGAARGAGLLVLPGSRQAAVAVAGWLALVGAGAWLGGGAVVALVSRRARRSAPVARRVRALGRWAAPPVLVLAGLALVGALVPPAAPPAATVTEAGVLALTGALPPPLPLTAARAALGTAPDPLWLVLALGGAVAYLLAARGLGWPRARTAAWCAGCLVTTWATSGGVAAYAPLLLSAQMIVHAVLVVVAAPLLAAGAPSRLVQRAVAPRDDGTAGVREVVGAISTLRVTAVLRRPAAALAVLLAVLAAVWATPLLPVATGTLAGHEAATAAVLGAGFLAAAAASDRRGAAALAIPVGLALAAVGAGAWLSTTQRLLAAGWSTRLGLGVDALADQRAGAVLAVTTVVVGCLVRVLSRGARRVVPVTVRARADLRRRAGTR